MEIGQIVTAFNKTGKYIGEVTAVGSDHHTVRILAVLNHPMQGNLHHPKQVDVSYFHERKALSFREQTNVPVKMVRPFEGEIPDYPTSLKMATMKLYEQLTEKKDDPFSIRSLETLTAAMHDYERRYDIQFEVLKST